MKTDSDSRNKIIAVILLILAALAIFILGKPSAKAQKPVQPSSVVVEQKKQVNYEELIYAYNIVLHRILIDRPSYFEDVLIESSEWCRLYNMLFDDDKDIIFTLSSTDSIEYHDNRLYEINGEPTTFKSSLE